MAELVGRWEDGARRGRRALGAVVAAGLVGCLGPAEEPARPSGPAPVTGAGGAATEPGAGAPTVVDAAAGRETRPVTAADPDPAGPGEAFVGPLPPPDPAWEARPAAGAVGAPASLGTRPAASQAEDEAWSRPQEWRSRRAPPWRGERLEARVRPKATPAPQPPQVKP